jgi:hypothetical protein
VTARSRQLRALILSAPLLTACRDVSSFSTGTGNRYVGPVVPADFVLSGIGSSVQLCLYLDADHLQDAPGNITSSDGTFHATPLRPIPQLWHDPLSTFTFGQGRIQNLLYMAEPAADSGVRVDVTVVISLMEGGSIETRLLRGAPPVVSPGATTTPPATNLFAVFDLTLQPGTCPF